ncbi:NADPH-dependent FMN reductase [Methyloligella solikamskensis]|uniref:NADPH-dependent FMN reductase n=1 Tax=Methyloligella solikamskensis TaxID=1177756 RepID=A0ABW3J709_9HYPH
MRLLFFAGSTREGSHNVKLAKHCRHIAEANGVEAIFVSLKDYELPLYNADLEESEGVPKAAREFKALMGEYDGVFIASPEYNSSVTPLLKNTLDWVSRVKEGEDVFKTRPFAIGGASPSYFGGFRSLLTLRQVLELGLGAHVVPQQVIVPSAHDSFEDTGHLKGDIKQKMAADTVEALVVAAKRHKAV